MNKELVEKLVNAFLSWELPSTVCSDQCVTVRNYPHQRLGTSLLNADEARQMVEHLAEMFINEPKQTVDVKGMVKQLWDKNCMDIEFISDADKYVMTEANFLFAVTEATQGIVAERDRLQSDCERAEIELERALDSEKRLTAENEQLQSRINAMVKELEDATSERDGLGRKYRYVETAKIQAIISKYGVKQ